MNFKIIFYIGDVMKKLLKKTYQKKIAEIFVFLNKLYKIIQ